MKKALLLLFVVAVVGLMALASTFRAVTLPVPEGPEVAVAAPPAPPPVRLSVLHAGRMFSAAAMAFRGGAFNDERIFGMDAVLIEHPQGSLLIDSGFGEDVAAHFATTPMLMQKVSRYEEEIPVAQQLRAAGRDPGDLLGVILTHAHWDHVSGLADLPGVPVWVPQAEHDFIHTGDPATALARNLAGSIEWQIYAFDDGPFLGFDRSLDVFDDGSVVLVPSGGHTPGSVIVFVSLPEGQRYGFVGDLVWQAEGITLPAERPWMTRRLVDVRADVVSERIVQLHRLAQQMPELTLVPAHDRRVMATLPALAPAAAP